MDFSKDARWSGDLNSKMPRVPKAGLKPETIRALGLVENGGVLLETTSGTSVPIQEVFDLNSFGYLRKIVAHRRRIRKELENLGKHSKEQKEIPHTQTKSKDVRLPFGIDPRDLKVVNCALCKIVLLAECLEYLRSDAEEFKLKTVRNFPPPVCARLFGSRPYCSDCVQALLDRGALRLVGPHQRSGQGTD